MGFWGKLTTPFKGTPSAPTARPYEADPYYDKAGQGTQIGRGADKIGYAALQKYLAREPGFTSDEQEAMYQPIAEQTKLEEQGALRRLNQGAAASGRYGSGGVAAGRGGIMTGGMRINSLAINPLSGI